MRRPQQDHHPHHHHHHHHHSNHHHSHPHHHHHNHHGSATSPTRARQAHDKDESRLARVKRALAGSLLGRGAATTRVFGARLDHLECHLDTGVPYVVHRLCGYIEAHGFQSAAVFRLSGGSPRLAERLRAAFERRGDADLESAACPPTAATLLRQYLKELPQPVVPSALVAQLLNVHAQEYASDRESWVKSTKELLSTLPSSHYRLLGYLAVYLSKYEAKHGRGAGVCGVFAPVILPHVPPATTLLRDVLAEATALFPDCVRESTVNGVIAGNDDCKICKDSREELKDAESASLLCALKPRKRKERRESCCQERKLIRSSSEERVLDSPADTADTIRRVSSHEDFNSEEHLHILSQIGQDMGHGVKCASLPLHERTNVSPVSKKPSPAPSPCDAIVATEKFECDAEKLRSSERFSRSVTPRGRRQARRRKVHRTPDADQNSSKENEEHDNMYNVSPGSNALNGSPGQSFLEMLSSGPSRSPSPARPPTVDHEDLNNPSLTNWSFQHRQTNEEATDDRVEAMLSPRNSLLIPRRFYTENEVQPPTPTAAELGLKNLTKHINGLKKKIKKYEDEFEENFGYRPSHSDKMSNRDIKRLCSELNKLRKEHKMLKEDPIGALLAAANNRLNAGITSPTNNNGQEKSRVASLEEMVKDVEKKLGDKRLKYNRPENMDELTYEQLLDEKTAVQKALLHIESVFGRPFSKEDRAVVRPLYDNYRTLKRLLIRAGPNKNKDSISELATILEHEAMDFTSASLPGNPTDSDRRASEPDMSHRGILDCIEPADQLPTDSDSQHSSSEGSRGTGESLHALPQEELLIQQRATREEKKRLRRALKELEAQFEARAGRKMQREDRGPQVTSVYEAYKQAKAKLRLIDALVAKNA